MRLSFVYFTRNGADRIAVFGSYARGEAGATSDIDILVRFAHPKSLFQLVRIEDELRRALGRDVDLVTENAASRLHCRQYIVMPW